MTMLSRPIVVNVVEETQVEGSFKRSSKERTVLAMSERDYRQTGTSVTVRDTMVLVADDEGRLVWLPRQGVRFVRVV